MTSAVIVAAVAVVLAAFALIERGTRRREAERAEEYRKEASLRGWKLEIDQRRLRYSGTTEGMPWTFDTIRHRKQGEVRHQSRWETTAVRSDEVLLVWPHDAKVNIRQDVPEFAKLLVFKSLEQVFGVDAGLLANAKVETVSDETVQFVAAVVTRDGMRLVIPVATPGPSEVAKVVKLGVRLAKARNLWSGGL
jgi:hypothetical protein